MPTIFIDGQELQVNDGENILEACLNAGLDLPYFCWHPAMGSIGSCRQCALVQYQNEDDTRGRIIMGCMTPVTEGARFSLKAENATEFREAVVESLMLNHPHDCPVCAEGGECHLQDMTVMVGHRDRRYSGKKNTHRNQYLGPLIHHEMNRCITCYRCERYYKDYAGGTDLGAQASHDHLYFGRHEEGVLESEFSGNLVEVCPTGVFTDKPFLKQYSRKWDLQSAPSICNGCAVGCNIAPGERYGKLKRVHNRYNHEVNGYFLSIAVALVVATSIAMRAWTMPASSRRMAAIWRCISSRRWRLLRAGCRAKKWLVLARQGPLWRLIICSGSWWAQSIFLPVSLRLRRH